MTAPRDPLDPADETAVALLQSLRAGDWQAARARFTPRFRAALDETELAAVWHETTAGLGLLQEATVIDRTDFGELRLRTVSLVFANGTAVASVSFDTATGAVEGLAVETAATKLS